jgi:hypothetical protein
MCILKILLKEDGSSVFSSCMNLFSVWSIFFLSSAWQCWRAPAIMLNRQCCYTNLVVSNLHISGKDFYFIGITMVWDMILALLLKQASNMLQKLLATKFMQLGASYIWRLKYMTINIQLKRSKLSSIFLLILCCYTICVPVLSDSLPFTVSLTQLIRLYDCEGIAW